MRRANKLYEAKAIAKQCSYQLTKGIISLKLSVSDRTKIMPQLGPIEQELNKLIELIENRIRIVEETEK